MAFEIDISSLPDKTEEAAKVDIDLTQLPDQAQAPGDILPPEDREGVADDHTRITCGGGMQLGRRWFKCWRIGGHGTVGQYIRPIAIFAPIAMLASLFVAYIFTPYFVNKIMTKED